MRDRLIDSKHSNNIVEFSIPREHAVIDCGYIEILATRNDMTKDDDILEIRIVNENIIDGYIDLPKEHYIRHNIMFFMIKPSNSIDLVDVVGISYGYDSDELSDMISTYKESLKNK